MVYHNWWIAKHFHIMEDVSAQMEDRSCILFKFSAESIMHTLEASPQNRVSNRRICYGGVTKMLYHLGSPSRTGGTQRTSEPKPLSYKHYLLITVVPARVRLSFPQSGSAEAFTVGSLAAARVLRRFMQEFKRRASGGRPGSPALMGPRNLLRAQARLDGLHQ